MTGLVLSVMPMADYDRRLLLLTAERGKISAFARGARRPGSPLLGTTDLYVFGDFELYEGRSSYTVKNITVKERFSFLQGDMGKMCYAAYFAELASYFAQENEDDSKLLMSLYLALKSLGRDDIPDTLVQGIYELKVLQLGGEYYEEPLGALTGAARYAWDFVLSAPFEKLFSFRLTPEDEASFLREVRAQMQHFVKHTFKSLEVLEEIKSVLLTNP